MSKGSALKARLNIQAVRLLPEVLELARQGLVPAGAYGNRESYKEVVHYIDKVELEYEDLIFDPQTSGGLLFAVGADDAELLVKDLIGIGFDASVIGEMLQLEAGEKAGLVETVFK